MGSDPFLVLAMWKGNSGLLDDAAVGTDDVDEEEVDGVAAVAFNEEAG